MLFNICFLTAVLASSGLAAEDVLHSKRMNKRFIDGQGNYNISFYHINDVHAHLDEFRSTGTDCTNPSQGCFGGYARVKSVIDATRPGHNDSLFLNVGDEFQGTLFYSYYGGEKIAETLNQLGFDGMTLGNHEFDGGDAKLAAFLQNLTFPIISANIVSDNPVLNRTIKPYHIYPQYELAVIGVTTETTPSISSPGPGTKFTDVTTAVQNTIDHIKATTNITRIAAITHIGYEEDQKLAAATTGLQLIMGGHSHTPLGNFAGAAGPYPTIRTNKDGDEVFIVTAYRWGEYLGYIDVTYSPGGKILAYRGAPIHLDNKTTQDPGLQAQIKEWRKPFEAFAAEVVGQASVELDQSACRSGECLLGNVMADAMLESTQGSTPTPDFAIINSGGIRATIDAGPITRGEILTSFPFGNSIVQITLNGSELWKSLEGVYTRTNQYNNLSVTSTVQLSRNISLTYNPLNANGSKLVSVSVRGQPIDRNRNYSMVTLDFLAGGGDNIFLKRGAGGFVVLDTQDEVLTAFVQTSSPVNASLEGRIRAVNSTSSSSSPAGGNGTGASNATATGAARTNEGARGYNVGLGPYGGSTCGLLVVLAALFTLL